MSAQKLLILLIAIFFTSSCSKQISSTILDDSEPSKNSSSIFQHGVASGDPSETSVVLWTSVVADLGANPKVEWTISNSEDMSTVVATGVMKRTSADATTFKVKASGLNPSSRYYYQFVYKGQRSVVGKTKTIGPSESLQIGVVSCANYEAGYFNSYDALAKKELDLVMHLGDYIYEYAPGTYGDTTLQRKHVPAREIISLDDYRQRYAQYRMDESLQLVHQNHPFVNIWDDHEISNNAYKDGAENHQEDEGSYATRAAIAKQAYTEWMPTELGMEGSLYRAFSFGNMATVVMLDGRLEGRTEQVENGASTQGQSMLGSTQLDWMKSQLSQSTANWKILGNQVIFAPLDLSRVSQRTHNMDAWDGYAEERNDVINFLATKDVQDVLIVSGDTHMSWGIEVPFHEQSYRYTKESVAVEIGIPSISSSNLNESASSEDVIFAEHVLKVANPHLKFVDGRNHGYVIMNLQKDTAVIDWYGVSNLKTRNYTERRIKRMTVNRGEKNKLN